LALKLAHKIFSAEGLEKPHFQTEAYREVGIAGLIIRHLVLPQGISGTEGIARFIAQEVSVETYVSLMSQYMPCYKADNFKEISRRISRREYQAAQEALQKWGLFNGWTQSAHGLEALAGINIKPT